MMAVEPLSGKRIVEVKEQKTKKDYALFIIPTFLSFFLYKISISSYNN